MYIQLKVTMALHLNCIAAAVVCYFTGMVLYAW